MKKFPWGKVLEIFEYDFDGKPLEIVKYHPWKSEGVSVKTGNPNEDETCYHIAAMSESFHSIDAALIGWIAHKNLGLNHGTLAAGVCRALNVREYVQWQK
jgi:hypothetical protein